MCDNCTTLDGKRRTFSEMLLIGECYGYPKCCTHNFVKTIITKDHGPEVNKKSEGTGFAPCRKCAKKSKRDIAKMVERNRICEVPFPYGAQISTDDIVALMQSR